MRILLADDDRTFCGFLKELLMEKGYDVDATTRGLEAYKMSQRAFYDLFIFDVRMPFLVGGVVLLIAAYIDWRDSTRSI